MSQHAKSTPENKEQLVKVKDLTTDHKLQLEDGSWQRIRSVENGFYFGSTLITYANGLWSCLLNNDKVEARSCN